MPEQVGFHTKPQLAQLMLQRALAAGVTTIPCVLLAEPGSAAGLEPIVDALPDEAGLDAILANVERSPLFKGGVHGAIVNNLIYDPQKRAIHYNLMALEWQHRPYEIGKMSVVGNVMRGGPSTEDKLPFMMIGGDGDVEYFGRDNVAVDRFGNALPMFGMNGYGASPVSTQNRVAPRP